MRKLFIPLAVAAALATSLVLPSAAGAEPARPDKGAPPSAEPAMLSTSSCYSGQFCVWYWRYAVNPMYAWYGSDSNWTTNYFSNGARVNDNDQSWYNHGVACYRCDRVAVYRDIYYGGGVTIYLARGQYVGYNPYAEDRGSSHRWY